MSNMTIKQMEAVVKDYIDDDFPGEYRYALMLNGNWGSGKTYFIQKNIIQTYIREGKSAQGIYVSLNGLKDRNEITSSLMSAVASKKYGKVILSITHLSKGLFQDYLEQRIGRKSAENIDKIINLSSFKEGEFFFVFDDLERCLMPLEESLGFISSFVEQYKAKVIILANEVEIKNGFAQRMDYYQFAMNKDLKIDLSNKKQSSQPKGSSRNGEIDSIDLSDLIPRAQKISEMLGTYNQIKEKAVGKTIDFCPSIQDSIENILSPSFDNYYPGFPNEAAILIANTMEKCKHRNLRTVYFSMEIFNEFAAYIPEKQFDAQLYQELLKTMFNMIFLTAANLKSGGNEPQWREYEIYRFDDFGGILSHGEISLKVVHDRIYKNTLNPEEVKKAIRIYSDLINKYVMEREKYFSILKDFDLYSEREVDAAIYQVNEGLQKGNYLITTFDRILSQMSTLREIGFQSVNLERCVLAMQNALREMDMGILESWKFHYTKSPDEKGYQAYCNSIDQLSNFCEEEKNKRKASIAEVVENGVTGEPGWWGKLCEELDQKNREGIIYNCVFDYCTVKQWSKAIVKSESKDLSGLVRHFRNVKKDLAAPARAGELARQLEKDIAELPAPVDKIRKYNIENLIEILK